MADIEDVERDFIMETMEPFIGDHHPKVLANRMDQNRILDDLDELVAGLAEFQQGARLVLVRSRFTSGQRKHKPGEMGEMEGTQATHYGDPTGEAAAWNADAGSDGAEMVDAIAKTIAGLAQTISNANSIKKWLLNISSTDVAERAKRSIPDCLACGKPVVGRVIMRYDRSCYDKWIYYQQTHKNPDKHQFEREMKAKLAPSEPKQELEKSDGS